MTKRAHIPVSVLILGDQLDHEHPALVRAQAAQTRVLMIESEALLSGRRWHRQRLHLVLSAMRHYAAELRARGFAVDYRRAQSFRAGLAEHRKQFDPKQILCAEPMSHGLRRALPQLGVELVRHDRFMCHYSDFDAWAKRQRVLRMDAFYRMRRRATGYLMDADKPIGGAFSFDTENREPASRAPKRWPAALRDDLDPIDEAVVRELPIQAFGAEPDGTWAVTRKGALRRLAHFIQHVLPGFGPYQDVMLHRSWHMSHSMLSPYLNLGLLHPREVCDAIAVAYENGSVPLASAEGCLRQILGWREYIWGTYWHFGVEYGSSNTLQANRALLPLYEDPARTRMQCMRDALHSIEEHGYAHHIQRLMLLGNLALLAGVRPLELSRYMQVSFIDGGEWVMWPNVLGMATYADGGRMSTKPYAAGGAYIHRMSDACGRCVYRPGERVGERACPFTTLYWSFFERHRERFADHPRVRNIVRGLERLKDRRETLAHAEHVLQGLSEGTV
jgi:deoxyribodipyrimidine photolyase-related protein